MPTKTVDPCTKMPKEKIKLIPPDSMVCQAEKPNGYSFMTLGGVPGRRRCGNMPIFIVHETVADKDGVCGSMSLCQECFIKFLEQEGLTNIRLEAINVH